LRDVIVALRFVCGAAAVVEVLRDGEPCAKDRQRADDYDAMATHLQQALTTRTELPKPKHDAEAAADDLGQAINQLAGALNTYVALPSR
jgi:hypothetical protein